MWWLFLACSGDADLDPWAPPPLPEGVPAADPDDAELEALLGGSVDDAAVGAWIGQAATADEVTRRARAAQLTRVEHLVLAPGAWDADRTRALAASAFPDLTMLDASGVQLQDGAAAALASAPWTRQLTHLDLSESELGRDDVRAMAAGDLRRVEVLRLRDAGLDDDALIGVLDWRLGPLSELDLSGNALTEPGFRALAGSARVDQVRRLLLARTGADAVAVFALTTSPYAATVEHLDLRQNGLGDGEWSDLRAAFGDDAIPMD